MDLPEQFAVAWVAISRTVRQPVRAALAIRFFTGTHPNDISNREVMLGSKHAFEKGPKRRRIPCWFNIPGLRVCGSRYLHEGHQVGSVVSQRDTWPDRHESIVPPVEEEGWSVHVTRFGDSVDRIEIPQSEPPGDDSLRYSGQERRESALTRRQTDRGAPIKRGRVEHHGTHMSRLRRAVHEGFDNTTSHGVAVQHHRACTMNQRIADARFDILPLCCSEVIEPIGAVGCPGIIAIGEVKDRQTERDKGGRCSERIGATCFVPVNEYGPHRKAARNVPRRHWPQWIRHLDRRIPGMEVRWSSEDCNVKINELSTPQVVGVATEMSHHRVSGQRDDGTEDDPSSRPIEGEFARSLAAARTRQGNGAAAECQHFEAVAGPVGPYIK